MLQLLYEAGIITFLKLTELRLERSIVEIQTYSEWVQKGRGGFQRQIYTT